MLIIVKYGNRRPFRAQERLCVLGRMSRRHNTYRQTSDDLYFKTCCGKESKRPVKTNTTLRG